MSAVCDEGAESEGRDSVAYRAALWALRLKMRKLVGATLPLFQVYSSIVRTNSCKFQRVLHAAFPPQRRTSHVPDWLWSFVAAAMLATTSAAFSR